MPARRKSTWSCKLSRPGSVLSLLLGAVLARAAAPLPLYQKNYRVRAGEGVVLDAPAETVAQVRAAVKRSATVERNPGVHFVLTPGEDGTLLLTPALRTPPGRYEVTVTATRADGTALQNTLSVILDPVKTVPSTATRPAVILLNGFQLANCSACQPSNTTPHSKNTFGSLETQLLSDGVPVVYFFDNCVEAPNAKIEDLGNALAQFMSLIKDDTGALVPQVDLVGHSMGGLIARAYFAGLQTDGSLAPPANPRVRKLAMIATPNFGSFIAAEFAVLLGPQGAEMEPGTPFLWNLNRWNQFTDDLRGVDALAIAGNAGPLVDQAKASDGVVSLTSAALGFTRDAAHTRILPYCHTGGLAIVGCLANGIANADEAPETAQIVRSFLSGTSAWSAIGGTPDEDQYLSQDGGVYFAEENAAGTQYLNDLSQVSWGSTALQSVNGSVFYNELVKTGANSFAATSTAAGQLACGPNTVPAGYSATFRCKTSAAIASVGPLAMIVCITTPCPTPAKLVLPGSGGAITITGTGFGSPCTACVVTANPGGVNLQIASWTDTSIAARLPASVGAGLFQLTVQSSGGADSINIMIPALTGAFGPVITSVTNAASGVSGNLAPGEMITIKGVGLGPAVGVQFSLNAAGRVDTTLAGVQVLVGGFPAAITYASATQVNAIVSWGAYPGRAGPVQVQYQGAVSPVFQLGVDSVAPGVFTFNSTGMGQAVAANQDGSFNGPSGSGPFSPAPKGSFVVIYFTGCGELFPNQFLDGSVNPTNVLEPIENPGIVTVGGKLTDVYFMGQAPGLVGGVCQLNIKLPADIPTGDALPLVIGMGGALGPRAVLSQPNATLAVQ
jgi:uncharacterized protein (TIGR03437 family)